jgi:predicted permease
MIRRLLLWLTDDALADAIAGDLAEERARRARRDGRERAALWHGIAMARIGSHVMTRRLVDVLRAAARGLLPGRRRGSMRQAARSLRRSPWYTASVIAIVALSMTVATTTFAVVDGVLFKALPYPNADELYVLSGIFDDEAAKPDRIVHMVSPLEVNAWREAVPGLQVAILGSRGYRLDDGTLVDAMVVDPDFFRVFGVPLLIGGLTRDDFEANAGDQPVVISHRLWQRLFDGEEGVLGRTVRPASTSLPRWRAAGVLAPEGVVPPLPDPDDQWVRRQNRVDVIIPSPNEPDFPERGSLAFVRVPGDERVAVTGAMKAAVRAYKADNPPLSEFDRLPSQRPFDDIELLPLADFLTVRQRPVLALVFVTALGLSVLVLLNAGALAAARAQRRLRELAMRRSLGARTSDLVRDALAEQAWLVGLGATLGLLLSVWLIDVVGQTLPPGLNLLKPLQVDWRAAAFALGLSGGMAVAVAILSVRRVVRSAAPSVALGTARVSAPVGLGRWLVAGQIAIAFAIVLGGTMFVTSLGMMAAADTGIASRNAVMLRLSSDGTPTAHLEAVMDRLRAMPGVRAVGLFDRPLFDNLRFPSITFQDPSGEMPARPWPVLLRVGPGFFDAAGITLLDGRFPSDAELAGEAPVMVVSAALARRYWPRDRAVGQTLRARVGGASSTVVGVVKDVRMVAGDAPGEEAIFVGRNFERTGAHAFMAFEANPDVLLPDVLAAITAADPALRVPEAERVDDALARSVSPRRISALAAFVFAACALMLVAVGLVGLVAQITGWRTHEMGIRVALGSSAGSITRLIVGEQLTAVAAGLAAGLAIAAGAARFVGKYLYGVTPYDARVWSVAAVLVLACAGLAALVPAMRASRVDPVVALKAE